MSTPHYYASFWRTDRWALVYLGLNLGEALQNVANTAKQTVESAKSPDQKTVLENLGKGAKDALNKVVNGGKVDPKGALEAVQSAAPAVLNEVKKVVPQAETLMNQAVAAGANILKPAAEPTPEDHAEFNNRINALKNMLMANPEMRAVLEAKLTTPDKINMFWANYDIMIHYPLGYGFDTDRMMSDVEKRGNMEPAQQAIVESIFNDKAAFDEVMHTAFRLSAGTPELKAVLQNPVARSEIKKLVQANIPNIMGMRDQFEKFPMGAMIMSAAASGVAGGVEANMDHIVQLLQTNPALLQMVIDQAWTHRHSFEKAARLRVPLNISMPTTADDLSLPGAYDTFRAETYLGNHEAFDMYVVRVAEGRYRVMGINDNDAGDELVCSVQEFATNTECYTFLRNRGQLDMRDLNDQESDYADLETAAVKSDYPNFYKSLETKLKEGPGLPN